MAKPTRKVKKPVNNQKPRIIKKKPIVTKVIESDNTIKKSKVEIVDNRPKCYVCGKPIKDIHSAVVVDCRMPKIYRHQRCAYEIVRRYMKSQGVDYNFDDKKGKDDDE